MRFLVPILGPESELRPLRLQWPVVPSGSTYDYYLDVTGKLIVRIDYPCGRVTWWQAVEE